MKCMKLQCKQKLLTSANKKVKNSQKFLNFLYSEANMWFLEIRNREFRLQLKKLILNYVIK